MSDEDKLIYRVELDFGDAQQKFENINAAGERLEQTVDGIRQKVAGNSIATNFLDEAATSATVALERMEELKTRGESGHLGDYARTMNITEFRNAESSLSAIVQDMQRIEKLSQTINQRASEYTKKRIDAIMPGMQKMAQEGADLYIGSGTMPTDQQIVSAIKARMNNNNVRKTLFGRDKIDEAVYDAIVEQAVISGVSQTQRGSFMKRIIKDTSQSPHIWNSFHDMLPRAFQEINSQLKDPKYVSKVEDREKTTYDTFLTPHERKQLTNLILKNAQFASAAEQTGIARRNHGKMEVLSGVTRAMVDQTGSFLFDELVGAAKGMGMYGIEDVNDPKFWDRIEPKNNVRLRGSLQAARYLNDTYNWMQARRFNQTQWKRFQPSTKSEFISEGDIDFAPLIDQYEVARYTIDDIKNNRNWNNNKKYTDFRDYHHFSIDRSAHLDRIMQHSPQGVRGNNSYLDDVIYVEVDPRLGDPTLDEKERATILKGYERLFSKKTKLSDGTIVNGVISGKGKNADNEDYVMTRINPKSGIEFVRKSRYEAVRKDDPSYWSYGYDPLRDYAYQDFAGGLEYRNKNATPGQSIQKLYGSSLPKNIILVDLEDTTKVASGEKQEKGATGIGAGLNGASIISNRFLPVGAQARLPGVKTALMTANMEGMLEPYGGKIMLTALTGSEKEKGKLVELNPDVDLMINKADLKGAGVKWEGRTYDEILTDFKDYLQKGEITVKQRYADANKRSRWMSPQMAQILAMDNRGTDMFTDAFMHEYWLAGDYNGAMQTVFADDDVTRQRLVKQPGLFNSKEIQNRIKEYRKALLHHVSIGGLVMPEELEFQQAMAAPWIIDAFNANLRNTKQWDKLSKDKQTLLTALEMGDNRVLFNESTSKMLGIARYPATAQSIQSAVNAIDDKKLTEFFTKAGFDPHGVYVSTTSPLMELLQGADFDGDVLNIIRMMSDGKSAPIDIMRAIVEKTMKINAERFKDNPEEMKKRNALLNRQLGKAEKYNFNNPKHLVEWLNAYALQSSAMGAPNATLRNAFQMDINDDVIRGMSDAEEQYKINSVEGKKAEHRDLSSEQNKILQYKPFSELYHIIDKNRDENGRLKMEEIQKKDLFNVNLPSRFMSGNMRSQMVSRFRLKQKGVNVNAGYPWAEIFSSRYPDLDKDTAKGRMQSALRDVYMGFLNADYFALSDYTAAQLLVLKDEALEAEQKNIVEELEKGAKIVNGKGKELTVKDTSGIAAEARRRLAKEGVNVIENIGDYALVESAIYENEPVQKLYGQMAQMGFKGLIGKVNLDHYLTKTSSQSPYSPSAQQLEKIKTRDSTLQGLSELSEKQLAEKINNLHLSPTQISEIIRDPRAWAAKRLGGVKDDFTGNYGTAIGDAGHVAIESFLMARMNYGREHNGALMPQEELEKAAAAALQVYDEQVGKNMLALPQGQAELDAMINGTGASHRKHLRVRDYIQNRLLTLYPEDKFAIEAVENKLNGNNPENKGTPLKFNLGNKINSDDPVESLGYFDALVRNRESNQYRIVDLKNQANVKGSDLAKWMMQVYMYGEALPDFIKETGLPELGLEGIDIFKVEENQTQHLDANPEKIKEYGNKVRQAISLIQQLPEAGITDESLNALSYSLKQLFPDVNTDQASSQFAQMVQQEQNISKQLSGTDGKAFGGALLLHDQFNQALDRVNGVNQFLRKADPNRDGVYNSWLLNDRQLSGAKDLIPQLQKEGHYVEAATLEAEINNARSQFDAILPEASVKNLEDATQKLHDFNQDMQTSKGANSRIDFYRQISEEAQHAADANTVLEGRIKQVSAELSKNQLKLKNEADPTRKANLESEIDKQAESIDAMRRTVKANKIRDRGLRAEKSIFDTKFREETWNELNEGYTRLQALRSGKVYSRGASVEEDVDAYRKEVLQQIADAQQYAKKQFRVKRGQGLPDDKVGIIDSESKEYKDYINSLQLMLRGGNIQAVRSRFINDSLRGFSIDQANVLKNVEHAALDDKYVDELNIEEAVRQKQKEIESKRINLEKRLKNTKLNSKQQQMYQRIIDNYDKFDSGKYAEQLKTENENRREINRIHDMQQVAREMNIFGDNTDYMKSSNRAAALMQFEALQKRVSKISDDNLPDYMKRFKQITEGDFLKAYDRNEKESYDRIVAQQRIQDQQRLMQAERAEIQAEQMNRNWQTRTLTDPFTRNYLQRRNMYDQYRGQVGNSTLQLNQAKEAQRRAQEAERLARDPENKKNAKAQYDSASAAVAHWEEALRSAREGMREFGDENGEFNAAFQMTAATIETVSTAADKLIQNFGRQVLRNAFNEAKNFVVQFDSQMRTIQAITMKTDEQMQSVKQATVDRAIELRTSVANVAQVEADLYRQGLNDQQVEERSDAIVKFATVTGAKVGDAGKAITTAIQNGLVSSAEEAMDVMTALGDSAATTANEIFKGMQKSAAAAKVAGVSYDELTTLLTIGTSKTQLSGNVIGTGLQTIFSRMNRVTNEGYANDENGKTTTINDVEKALKSAGVQLRTEDGRSFRGSFDVLRDLSRVWSGLSDIQRSNVTYTMAGGRQTNMFTTLMEGMSEDGGAWLDELLGLAEGSEGTTENKYAIAAKSITASLNELKSTYDGIVENLAGGGVITSGIDMVTSLVSGFKDLTDSAPGVAAGAGIIGTAIAGLFAKIASGLAMANMASGPAGLISTLIAIAAGGAVFGGASLIGSLMKDAKEANDPNKQQELKEEEANRVYQLQNRRMSPIRDQIKEVEKLGEAWDKTGKNMNSVEAKNLGDALKQLNQQMTGLTGNFTQQGEAITNWRKIIDGAEETVDNLEYEALSHVDTVKEAGIRLEADQLYKQYDEAKALRSLHFSKAFFAQNSRDNSYVSKTGELYKEIYERDFRGTPQELVDQLVEFAEVGAPIIYSGRIDALKQLKTGSFDELRTSAESFLNEEAAIEYLGEAILKGAEPQTDQQKSLAGLWKRFIESDVMDSYLLRSGFDQSIFKEGTEELDKTVLENLDGSQVAKLYEAMISFQKLGASQQAAYGEAQFQSSAQDLIKSSIVGSARLQNIFSGNASWLERAAEQAVKNIDPSKFADSKELTDVIIAEQNRLVNRYKGASNELVNSEINAADYQRRIKYRNKKGELVEFGTNNTTSDAQMLADLHEASVQAETSDIQANTSAVQQAGTQAAQAGANAKAGGEAFKAGVDALAEQNKDKESEPVEVKIDLTINKDGEISTSVDGEDKKTSGNAFNAPSGAIVVANNMASDVRHGIAFKPEWMNQLGDLQNEPDIEKALGSLIQLATDDPDFAKYMHQFADPLREITEKANEYKAQMDAKNERQRKLKLQNDLNEKEEEASFFEASPGVQAELDRQRRLKLQKELNEKEEEASFFEASPGVQAQIDAEAERQRRLKLQEELNEKEEEASFFEPKANVQAAIDQSKEKELERLRAAVQKAQEEEEEISWFDEPKAGVQETLDRDPRAAAERTIKEARAYYEIYGNKNDNPDPIADLYYDGNYGGEKVAKLIEALRLIYDTKKLSENQILAAFGIKQKAVESNSTNVARQGEQTQSDAENTVESDIIGSQKETPNVLSQYAGDNNWGTSYSGTYSQLLGFAKQSTTWDELIKNIGKTNIPDLNEALTNDKNVLGALQGFYNGDISQQELVDTLQTAFLGSTMRDQGRNLMSSTFSYEQQAAALDAVMNGTASSEQYDMIASQYGIDRNRLQNNIGLFTAMESKRLSAERGNIEFKANDYFNDLFSGRLIQGEAFRNLRNNSIGINFDSLIYDKASNDEKQLIDSAKAAGFNFAIDDAGKIIATYNGQPYKQEDELNPYEWNRNLGRSQARADIMEYLQDGELSGENVKQRIQNMKNYSSEVAQYIALTDEARKSTEGLALLEQIRIKVHVDGLDDLVALGQMSQEAVTWATQLATGGTMKFDARRAIRASTLETSQLGGLANATELTPEMRQAMMQYLNIDETTFNTKDWTEWQKELRDELSSVEFRESLQNDFLEAYVAAFESGDQTSMDRIKNSISALGGKLIDDGTMQSVIFGDNWFKNINYQANTTLKDTSKYFDPATLKNYRNELYNGTLTDIADEDVQKALRERYGNDIDILANQERYTARQIEIAKNNTDLVDQLESYKELTQLGKLPDNAESLAQSLFGQSTVGRNQAQAQIRQEANSIQELAAAFNAGPDARTAEQWQLMFNLLGVNSKGEVNEAEASKAIQDQLDVWITFLDKIAESNPEMQAFVDNVKTMLGGGDISKIDLKTNLLDEHEVQLSTTSLLEYVDQLVAAGEAGEKMFGNLPENIQQQLMNFGGLADFMKTYGENTAEAAKAQRDLTLSIVTGTLEALEQEGKIISGISGQMETMLFGNDVDRKKQTNQMIDQITEYANVREAYNRLISGDRTRQEDWDMFKGFWNISDRRLQEYQLGQRSLITDYGKEMESVTDLQQETAKDAVEAILRAEAGENGYVYDYSDISYVAEMQRRGQAPKVKARQKTLEEMVSEMTTDQIANFNRNFSDFGVFIDESGQLQTTAIADQQLTLGQILQRNLMMRDRIVGTKGREEDAARALRIFDNVGGDKDKFASWIDKYKFESSAIEELMGNGDFIEALSKGDNSTARRMIAEIGGLTLPNQTRMSDVEKYISAALSGDRETLETMTDADVKEFANNIAGFQEAYNAVMDNMTLTDEQRKTLEGGAAYQRARELEQAGTVRKGTADLASQLATGTVSEQRSLIGQQASIAHESQRTVDIMDYLIEHSGESNEAMWKEFQQRENLDDDAIEHYKESTEALRRLRDEEQAEASLIIESLKAAIKSALNLDDFSDIENGLHEAFKNLLLDSLNVEGLELITDDEGNVDIKEQKQKTPWEILTGTGQGTYNDDYETKQRRNDFVQLLRDSSSLEDFQQRYNEAAANTPWMQNKTDVRSVIGQDYATMIEQMQSGRYSWDQIQNMFTQASGYSPLYKDQKFDLGLSKMQEYFGSNFGVSDNVDFSDSSIKSFSDYVASGDGQVALDFLGQFKQGTEFLETLNSGNLDDLKSTMRALNNEIAGSKVQNLNKYKDDTEAIAQNIMDLGKNARTSVTAVGSLISKMNQLSDKATAAQKARGKAGKDIDSKTRGVLSSATGLGEQDIKQLTADQVDQLAKMVEASAEEEFEATIGNILAEQATRTISEALAGSNIDVAALVHFDVNGDGNFDMSELAALAQQLDDEALATLASYAGKIADLVLEYSTTADSISVEAVLHSLLGGGGYKSSGGGGGGGGGKSAAQELMEELKRAKALRDHEIKMIQYQETKYENAGEIGNQNRMIELENVAQQKLIKTLEDAINKTKQQMAQTKKGSDDWYSLYESVLTYEEGIEEANQAIADNTRKIKENEQAILKLHTDLEQAVDQEIRNRIQMQRDMLDGTVSMEDVVLEAIRQRYRDEWALIQKDIEKKKAALEEEKNLIDERLQRRKDAEDEAEKYEELAEYKRQLALISLDSTRTKDAAKLREQIANLEKEQAWNIAQDEADYQKEQIDEQIQAYDDFVTYGDEDLEEFLANANNMADEVNGVMQLSQEGMMDWLKDNVKEYALAMDDAQKQMIQGWTDTYEQMLGITHTYWDEIAQILSGKDTWLAYMQQSQEYIDASTDERAQMLYEWSEMYDNWLLAQKRDAVYSHTDDQLNGTGSSGKGGGGGGKTNKDSLKVDINWPKDIELGIRNAISPGIDPNGVEPSSGTKESTAGSKVQNGKTDAIVNPLITWVNTIFGTHFDKGGLVDFTGPAWVDGTKTKPEAFLDAEDTALIRGFLDQAQYVRYRSTVSNIDSNSFGGNSQNIGEVIVNITEAQFKDDADFDEVAHRVGQQFVKEISKQGFNTMSYSF